MKKILLIVGAFVLCVSLTACGSKKENGGTTDNNGGNNGNNATQPVQMTANTNPEVINGAVIDGIKISNVSLISEGEHATFTADVTNTTDQNIAIKTISIIMRNSDGQEVVNLSGFVGNNLVPSGTHGIITYAEQNLSSVTSVEYVINY